MNSLHSIQTLRIHLQLQHHPPQMQYQKGCHRFVWRAGCTPAWCVKHKTEGMVNSRHRICCADGCAANATFRAPGDKHPTLCGAHRTEGMMQAGTGAKYLLRC